MTSALQGWIDVRSLRKKLPCSDRTGEVDIKDWWDQIARRMPSTRTEWTRMVQSLRRVKCQILSARVPTGTPKSRRHSPEAELRWVQEFEGGGVFQTRIRYLPEALPHQGVWTKAVRAAEGHVARKARETIEDEI